jgi:hypothetical protein
MTDLRQSQSLAEVWVAGGTGRGIVSQATLEAWINRLPVISTAEIVSQALAEVWATNVMHPTTDLVVSTALIEVWATPPVVFRVFWLSAQTV